MRFCGICALSISILASSLHPSSSYLHSPERSRPSACTKPLAAAATNHPLGPSRSHRFTKSNPPSFPCENLRPRTSRSTKTQQKNRVSTPPHLRPLHQFLQRLTSRRPN